MMTQKKRKTYSIAVVFGTFDGIHPGHVNFLQQAHKLARHVVAIIARDSQVREHKHKKARISERSRRARAAVHPLICHAYLGDKKSGEYKILRRLHPDIIILGYDQHVLKKDLERWMNTMDMHISIRVAQAYQPRIYHTSFFTHARK